MFIQGNQHMANKTDDAVWPLPTDAANVTKLRSHHCAPSTTGCNTRRPSLIARTTAMRCHQTCKDIVARQIYLRLKIELKHPERCIEYHAGWRLGWWVRKLLNHKTHMYMIRMGLLGGETGIRTLGTRKGSTVFETATFDHSATSPRWVIEGLIISPRPSRKGFR